ncbi:MAG: glutathione S-transferase family protein [Candidatus Binatus sp.]
MSDKLILYDFHGSPCARRVRIVMLEKGLEWEPRLVDLTKMEQKRPEYLALNPNGLVPTLVHGDRVIYESNVITEYLDAVFPEPRLYPAKPWLCARAKMWQAFELAMAKEYRPLMYLRVIGPIDRQRLKDAVMADVRRSTDDPAHLDWVNRVYDGTAVTEDEAALLASQLYRRIDHIERELVGEFLLGDNFSIADISVYPRVAMYPMVGLQLDAAKYPRTTRWMSAMARRPSFKRSERVRPG